MPISDAQASIGFIGLGNIGGPMAERLVEAGVMLHVHDRNPDAMDALVRKGAQGHVSAATLADHAEIVCGCLPTLEACRAVTDGLAHGRRIRFYVEMSTVGGAAVRDAERRLHEHGVGVADAPVSGGAEGVRQGKLSIMLAGPPDVLNAVMPVLSMLSTRIFTVGDEAGQGQTMKLVNNLLAAANMATSFEALALGVKLGLPADKVVQVVNVSSGQNNGMTARKTAAILSRKFSGGGRISLMEKDIRLALDEAQAAGFPLSELRAMTGMARLWDEAIAQGMASDDVSALIQVIERAAGVEVHGAGG